LFLRARSPGNAAVTSFSALRYGAFLDLQERMGYSLARAQSYRPAWIQSMQEDLTDRLGADAFDTLVRRGRHIPPETLASEQLPHSVLALY